MAIVDLVRERGPLTVAAFMELALYDSRIGYYARMARRSGRAGDFFTSVDVGERLATSAGEVPLCFEGALLANELLDAFPVHQVVMREEGLCEVYVHAVGQADSGTSGGGLVTREGPLSTPALAEYLAHLK